MRSLYEVRETIEVILDVVSDRPSFSFFLFSSSFISRGFSSTCFCFTHVFRLLIAASLPRHVGRARREGKTAAPDVARSWREERCVSRETLERRRNNVKGNGGKEEGLSR